MAIWYPSEVLTGDGWIRASFVGGISVWPRHTKLQTPSSIDYYAAVDRDDCKNWQSVRGAAFCQRGERIEDFLPGHSLWLHARAQVAGDWFTESKGSRSPMAPL